MNDKQIDVFLEVAKERSTTKAAYNLFMTQPGVSRTIRALEKELNTTLFIRTPHKPMELTKSGRIFYEALSRCQNIFQDALMQSEELNHSKDFYLRFGCLTGWSTSQFLPPMLDVLKKKYPYLNIELQSQSLNTIPRLLTEDKLDLALTIDNPEFAYGEEKNWKRWEICRISKLILFSKLLKTKYPEIHCPEDLKDEPFLMGSSDSPSKARRDLVNAMRRYGFTPKIQNVSNLSTMIALVENGQGVMVMDEWSQSVYMPQFSSIRLPETHQVVLICRMGCSDNDRILTIKDTLIDMYK